MRLRLIVVTGAACACARGPAPAVHDGPVAIRFAIEAGPDVAGPLWVSPGGEGGPGWLSVTRDGRRVYLAERCGIADCGKDPAVCGAPVPLVRNLAAADRRVEFLWDGMLSEVDSAAGGCEVLRPATAGAYVASLCYSSEADLQGEPTSSGVALGRLVAPRCVERAFTLSDREVVLTM